MSERSEQGPNFIDTVGYREDREPDSQYQELLQKIMLSGEEMETTLQITDVDGETRNAKARHINMHMMRFDLRNGAPVVTERKLGGASLSGIAELTAFINGKHTLDQLEEFGVPRFWWEPQITDTKTAKRGLEPGDLGPGSYGPALTEMPTNEGVPFNQIKAAVDQIRENPGLRTHWMTTMYPQKMIRAEGYDQEVVVVPCHGSFLHFRVNNGELTLNHVQRSGDAAVGVAINMVQYTSLALMMAEATGTKAKEYVHVISDAHIYENQFEQVEELLDRNPNPFPKLLVDQNSPIDEEYLIKTGIARKDIFEFRKKHFKLDEYEAHQGFRIPTAS